VSDVLDGIGDDLDEGGDPSRRKSLWGLLVLACVAIVVACLMILLGGGKDDKNQSAPLPSDTANPVTVLPHSSTPRSPDKTSEGNESSSSSSSAPPATVHTDNPCPDEKSCAVDGDAGLIALVNAYRTEHKRDEVDGVVSENAKKCALRQGGSTCVPHYAWTSLPKQDAAAAMKKFQGFSGSWMLDAKMTKLEVGWAWDGSGWRVALLKSP
jgi:hypothetical protein